MSKPFYLTTAIDYVNGTPHLGHAYEKVVADVIARTHRALGEEVFFLTGLDEHGQKVQQAAQAAGQSPQTYCDELAESWRALTRRLNLCHNDFIRTTDPRHMTAVQAALSRLHEGGHLYKAPYRGYYSAKEETFLTEKDRGADGAFDPVWGQVLELEEENYYFRLRDHQPWLLAHVEAHPEFIAPENRRNEVLGFLKSSVLEDLCVSRPRARLSWGIPLPFAPDWVTYVWLDALANYITLPSFYGDPGVAPAFGGVAPPASAPAGGASLCLWPADLHLIGKDILKFHAVYWPILLRALGLPLPRQVLAHGWWQKDGQRMSKSTGNVVDPIAVIDDWGADAFRYYVVRELDLALDGNWTDASFAARYQAELANGLGNLVNRSLSMLKRYRQGIVPPRSDELAAEVSAAAAATLASLRAHQLQAGLKHIWEIVTLANQYVERTAPFRLAKDPAQSARLDAILYNLAEICRLLAVLLWPFLPETAGRIGAQLGLAGAPDRLSAAAWGGLPSGQPLGEITPLFPRRDDATKTRGS